MQQQYTPHCISRGEMSRASQWFPKMLHSDVFENTQHIKYRREAIRAFHVETGM